MFFYSFLIRGRFPDEARYALNLKGLTQVTPTYQKTVHSGPFHQGIKAFQTINPIPKPICQAVTIHQFPTTINLKIQLKLQSSQIPHPTLWPLRPSPVYSPPTFPIIARPNRLHIPERTLHLRLRIMPQGHHQLHEDQDGWQDLLRTMCWRFGG